MDHYKSRDIYKCRRCFRQFSDTSGTPWAYRKISFAERIGIGKEIGVALGEQRDHRLGVGLGVECGEPFVRPGDEVGPRLRGCVCGRCAGEPGFETAGLVFAGDEF